MAGKGKIARGALEGLSDIFTRTDANLAAKGVSGNVPEDIFETASYNKMENGLMRQYRREYGSEINSRDVVNSLFSPDSVNSLKLFFSNKIDLDDLEQINDDLANLIVNLSKEGYQKDQILNLMNPILKQKAEVRSLQSGRKDQFGQYRPADEKNEFGFTDEFGQFVPPDD